MNNFDISLLDQYLKEPIEIKGYLSGRGVVSINRGNNRMYAAFTGDSMSLYNAPIGNLLLRGRWNPANKNYDLQLRTKLNEEVNCDILGYYRPEDSYLDVNSSLNNLSVTYFEPLS